MKTDIECPKQIQHTSISHYENSSRSSQLLPVNLIDLEEK